MTAPPAQESLRGPHPGQRACGEFADRTKRVSCGRACGHLVGSEAKFSRTGYSNPFGKLDDQPIPAFKVPRVVKERLKELAAKEGLSFHEYLRELLTIAALGEKSVKGAYITRVESIAKTLKVR